MSMGQSSSIPLITVFMFYLGLRVLAEPILPTDSLTSEPIGINNVTNVTSATSVETIDETLLEKVLFFSGSIKTTMVNISSELMIKVADLTPPDSLVNHIFFKLSEYSGTVLLTLLVILIISVISKIIRSVIRYFKRKNIKRESKIQGYTNKTLNNSLDPPMENLYPNVTHQVPNDKKENGSDKKERSFVDPEQFTRIEEQLQYLIQYMGHISQCIDTIRVETNNKLSVISTEILDFRRERDETDCELLASNRQIVKYLTSATFGGDGDGEGSMELLSSGEPENRMDDFSLDSTQSKVIPRNENKNEHENEKAGDLFIPFTETQQNQETKWRGQSRESINYREKDENNNNNNFNETWNDSIDNRIDNNMYPIHDHHTLNGPMHTNDPNLYTKESINSVEYEGHVNTGLTTGLITPNSFHTQESGFSGNLLGGSGESFGPQFSHTESYPPSGLNIDYGGPTEDENNYSVGNKNSQRIPQKTIKARQDPFGLLL